VALVGHEPDLGRLMSWLLSGRQNSFVQFKKGAAALLEFSRVPRAGNGTLVWLLSATQLAAFA
jgi:phosphohistidine phosphatase